MPLTPELAQAEVERLRKLEGQKLPELTAFDYGKVQRPIEGLFRNTSEDLKRKIRPLPLHEQHRHLLLSLFVSIAQVLYSAVLSLIAEHPPGTVRNPKYVLVMPSINRQLIDLYVTLLYILDDFLPRVTEYQQSGWKDLKNNLETEIEKHGTDPIWTTYLCSKRETLDRNAVAYDITPQQQTDWMKSISWWDTPSQRKKKLGKKEKTHANNPGTAPSLTKMRLQFFMLSTSGGVAPHR